MKQAEFTIGQCIYHRLFACRGVIVDVDPVFMGTTAWYDRVAGSLPPKDQPWYHILVHAEDHETCVAERNLIEDNTREPVNLPVPGDFCVDFDRGIYPVDIQTN